MSARRTSTEDLSRELIMDTARKLFTQHGYEKSSMRQLATVLKCSHGAIYYHFKNKAALFQEIVSEDFLKLDHLLDEVMATELDSKQKCRLIFLKYMEFGLRNKNHYEMMFMLKDKEVQGYLHGKPNNSYEKFAASLYSLASESLSIKDIWSLFFSLHGFVAHYCYTSQTYEDVQPLAEAHADFLLKGL